MSTIQDESMKLVLRELKKMLKSLESTGCEMGQRWQNQQTVTHSFMEKGMMIVT